MRRPIHGMAALLHPLYKKPELYVDTALSMLQSDYVGIMFGEEDQLLIDAEFCSFMNNLGPSFSRAVASRKEVTKHPWHTHGRTGLPNLAHLALRILSQVRDVVIRI